MLNATAVAPLRAIKAAPKARATPSPAPASAMPEDQGAVPTADEQLVATTLREQVMAIYNAHWKDLSGPSQELLHIAAEVLEMPKDGIGTPHRAAQLLAGAIAVERAADPAGAAIAHMEAVHQSLDFATASYDIDMEGCEAMAAGIRAAQRQFREELSPPVQRAEDGSQGPYNQAQLFTVLTEVASVAMTLSDVLALAGQSKDEWQMRTLIDSANVHARLLGAMADTASGCNMRGDHDAWIYGPNFADEGKAGAA